MEAKSLPPVFLSGKKVNLHLLSAEHHLDSCVKWLNDSSLTQFLIAGRFPQYVSDEKEWFDRNSKSTNERICLAIHTIANGEFIGIMGLEKINFIHRHAMTGSFIGEERNRGQSYGHDAKMILLNHAFNRLNLHKVYATAIAFNQRSIKFNQRCGYKVEGRRQQHLFVDGQYHDEIMLAVFAEDFRPLWEDYQKE